MLVLRVARITIGRTTQKQSMENGCSPLEVLRVWKVRQAQHGNTDFIFSYDGLPINKSTIARIIARYAKLAGVPVIQAKGLRHFVSHLSFLITSVLVVSKRFGHSSREITLKHYAHLWRGIDDAVAESMAGCYQN
ncbi:tyrosine-type recombinase/integrase [Terribacillus saccharophilus]|uniref:tyrosine-type recombinase/integrase n=1 Tax=Terribacillus saccharophilus TaxID=361277 RepID=UPI0020D124AA|nr:tyrosine-type recombinase/integrase [Terribacillus saccharophilus]